MKLINIFLLILLTTSCVKSNYKTYDVYLNKSNNELLEVGNLLIKQDSIFFNKSIKLKDQSKISELIKLVETVNKEGSFQMISAPPDDYNCETYFKKEGINACDSDVDWTRIVKINNKEFIQWLKIYLSDYGIVIKERTNLIPSKKDTNRLN